MTANTGDSAPRLGVAVARLAALALLIGLLVLYSVFRQRLGGEHFLERAVFHLAYVLTLTATALCVFRARVLSETVVESVRSAPVLSALLVLNTCVVVLLILNVFTQVGLLALMILGSSSAIVFFLSSASRGERLPAEVLRASPLTFASVYLCLGAGEIFLRLHPEFVGGGGNPALRRIYSGLYSRNRFGLRDDEFELRRPDGTFRILSLGDSFTFGQGVSHTETYPEQMEIKLNSKASVLKYEVINAGASGANTADEVTYLRQEGLEFEPNLVTVQFFLNDVEARFERTAEKTNWVIDNVVKRPFRASYIVFFLRYRFDRVSESVARLLHGSEGQGDYLSGLVDSVEREGLGWRQRAAALDELGTLSGQTSIPIAVVIFPKPGDSENEQIRMINRSVADHSQRAGLHTIDLTDAFADIAPEEQIVSQADHHPSAALHGVAAEKIIDALRKGELLPRQGRSGR